MDFMLSAVSLMKKHFATLAKFAFFLLLFIELYALSLTSFIHFHTIIECLTIVVALIVVGLAAKTRALMPRLEDPFSFLVSLYLWVCLFDFAHMLTYKGMPLAEGLSANPPTQYWIGGRLLEAAGLALFFHIHFSYRWRGWENKVLATLAVLVLLSIAPFSLFPDAYIEGVGLTAFKIYAELVVIALILVAASCLYLHRKHYNRKQRVYFGLAFLFTIMAELFFTRYVGVYDQANAIGHVFRLASYFCVLYAYLSQPHLSSRPLSSIANPFALYIALSISSVGLAIAYTFNHYEEERYQEKMQLHDDEVASEWFNLVSANVQKYAIVAESVEAYVDSTSTLNENAFLRFSESLIQELPEVLGIRVETNAKNIYITNRYHQSAEIENRVKGYFESLNTLTTATSGNESLQGALLIAPKVLGVALSHPTVSASNGYHLLAQSKVIVLIDIERVIQSPALMSILEDHDIGMRFTADNDSTANTTIGNSQLLDTADNTGARRQSFGNGHLDLAILHKPAIAEHPNSLILSPWYWPLILIVWALSTALIYRVINQHFDIQVVRKRIAEQSKYLNVDELTGLLNRRAAIAMGENSIKLSERGGQPLTVLFMDLDGFKHVNDSYGHAVGDEVLVQTAGRIKSCLRSTDSLARFGGDEFLAMLHGAEYGQLRNIQQIINTVSAPIEVFGDSVCVGISIGLASFPHDGVTFSELVNAADSAMYHAKQNGKGRYVLFSDIAKA
ncbi:GGDEF domain-containing protein [Vibrio cholerae]|uniref:sensor domain-containing diguanylate cyclase n=1 Tax=Vibrio cholerae TaxID=666 RepID=UPI001A34B6FC|nr:GGDEF domain-containing protein [Vibrio cholerae]